VVLFPAGFTHAHAGLPPAGAAAKYAAVNFVTAPA
jgi:hypothetical protein